MITGGALGRSTKPQIGPLMNRIAALQDGTRLSPRAHEIRMFRNDIIHENLRELKIRLSRCSL